MKIQIMALIAIAALDGGAFAQPTCDVYSSLPIPGELAPDDKFGDSSAMEGDVIVMGAYGDDDLGPNAGSAYIYRFVQGTWVLEQKLLPNDGSAGQGFGLKLAISGNVVVVSAPLDDEAG